MRYNIHYYSYVIYIYIYIYSQILPFELAKVISHCIIWIPNIQDLVKTYLTRLWKQQDLNEVATSSHKVRSKSIIILVEAPNSLQLHSTWTIF